MAEGLRLPAAPSGWFRDRVAGQQSNRATLGGAARRLDQTSARPQAAGRHFLDLDSSESPTHGQQEASAYNGHFRCWCYHPLLIFNQFGDLDRLSCGGYVTVPRTGGWFGAGDRRYRDRGVELYFRADAAPQSASCTSGWRPRIFGTRSACREPGRVDRAPADPPWAGRRRAAGLLCQLSLPSRELDEARRVVAKVEWHQVEFCPRVGFLVTNLTRPAERVVKSATVAARPSNGSRKAEGDPLDAAVLPCLRPNAVRLQLHALAYNLANFMRTLALPEEVEHWSLTTLRESWSRSAPGPCATAATWCSSSPKWQCRAPFRRDPAPDGCSGQDRRRSRHPDRERRTMTTQQARCGHARPRTAQTRREQRGASLRSPLRIALLDCARPSEACLIQRSDASSAFGSRHMGNVG